MTTEAHSASVHFTTDAFGPGDKVAAWHEIYGRMIAKIDLEPPADNEFMVAAARATSWSWAGLDDEHRGALPQDGSLIDSNDVILDDHRNRLSGRLPVWPRNPP